MRARSTIPRSMIDEARLGELIPPDRMSEARSHLGLRDHDRMTGAHQDSITSPSSSSTCPATGGPTTHDAAAEHHGQGLKRGAAADGSGRTVRQKVEAMELDARKRRREVEESTSHTVEAARRRTDGPSASWDVPGDPEPWRRDPEWMPVWMHRDACRRRLELEEAMLEGQLTDAQGAGAETVPPPRTDHHLMSAGPLLFCNRCGAYALDRAGSKLMGQCSKAVARDVKRRLERMRQGLHPITGALRT